MRWAAANDVPDDLNIHDAVSTKTLKAAAPLYASRIKVHPKDVQGRYRTIKWAILGLCLCAGGAYLWIEYERQFALLVSTGPILGVLVLGFVLFSGALLILGNLTVDILYAYLDPRVRLG